MIPNDYPEMVLKMYDPEHEDATTPIIRAVKKPFNIIYCVPPKSSTTSMMSHLGRWACKF